jgi:hypothetical protein
MEGKRLFFLFSDIRSLSGLRSAGFSLSPVTSIWDGAGDGNIVRFSLT